MREKHEWREIYECGCARWDTGRPDFNLINMVIERPIVPGKCLEIGCGTGNNAIWLARRGFAVTGIDIVEYAVQRAREKSAAESVACEFIAADFLVDDVAGMPFDFIFDRGCFHSFDTDQEREMFAQRVARHISAQGLWLSLTGSADDPPRQMGPPRRSARDIVNAVEPYFEIISLNASRFDSNFPVPPRAWVCLLQKREQAPGCIENIPRI